MMSEQRRYLVCYDIANPKRLSRLQRYVAAQAMMLQYSVYLLYATERERDAFIAGMRQRINPQMDDVRIYPLPTEVKMHTIGMDISYINSNVWITP